MNPARRRSDRFSDIFQKRDDVVIGSLFDVEILGMENRARFRISAASSCGIWQSSAIASQASTSISSQISNFRWSDQILLISAGNNGRSCTEDKAAGLVEKRFRLRDGGFASSRQGLQSGEKQEAKSRDRSDQPLSRRGHAETSVILYAYLAAGQEIRNRCHHFLLLSVHEPTARIRSPAKAECAVLGFVEIGDSLSYVGHFCCEQVQCHGSL